MVWASCTWVRLRWCGRVHSCPHHSQLYYASCCTFTPRSHLRVHHAQRVNDRVEVVIVRRARRQLNGHPGAPTDKFAILGAADGQPGHLRSVGTGGEEVFGEGEKVSIVDPGVVPVRWYRWGRGRRKLAWVGVSRRGSAWVGGRWGGASGSLPEPSLPEPIADLLTNGRVRIGCWRRPRRERYEVEPTKSVKEQR